MKRYYYAYAGWLVFTLVAAWAVLEWYRYVEEIGYRELAARLSIDGADDDGAD